MSPTIQPIVEKLTEARAAYHDLLMGRTARVVIDQNGERVEFVPANRQQLYLYIQSLELQLATPSINRGPAGVTF
jgi:hypothetical protein